VMLRLATDVHPTVDARSSVSGGCYTRTQDGRS